MKFKDKEINMNFNLPIEESSHLTANLEDKCKLFHCIYCGIHPKAYTISYSKGNTENQLLEIVHIFPYGIDVLHVVGKLESNTEIVKTIFCGICSSSGNWVDIPLQTLNNFGYKTAEERKEDK